MLLTGETPLAYAVNGANVATVRYLLDHGAHPEKADNKGFTPLHFAAEEGLHISSFCLSAVLQFIFHVLDSREMNIMICI